MSTEFLEQVSDEFTPGDLETLGAYVHALEMVNKHVAQLEEQLKTANENVRLLSREQIPDLLLSRGLSEIKTADGKKVTVKEKISCGVPKDPDKKQVVLRWVIEQGGESIIDKNLIIGEPEESIKDYLLTKGIPFRNDIGVHHARFRSFMSEKLGLKKGSIADVNVEEVPKEANLFVYKETTIK